MSKSNRDHSENHDYDEDDSDSSSSSPDENPEKATEKDDQSKTTTETFRKHPFHKPSWGPYPTINITQTSPTKAAPQPSNIEHKIKEIKQHLRKSINQEKPPYQQNWVQPARSAGNVSIRNVIQGLTRKQSSSLYYRNISITLPWIIRQIARFSLLWEVIIYITIITNVGLNLYCAFFTFYRKSIWQVVQITELIFAADTIIRLSVEIWRYRTTATVIVFTAPYTILQCFLDVISMLPLLPLYYWLEGYSSLSKLALINIFRFNRIVRLYRSFKFFETLQRERIANEKWLFLFTFSNYYLGFIYCTACILVACVGVTFLDYLLLKDVHHLEATYLRRYQAKKPGYGSGSWDLFILTTNFATAVVTTVGYGDIYPYSALEMSICIVCMLVGAIFLNGFFTSQLTNFELELDGARFDLFFRLKEIQRYLTNISTLPFFNAKVDEYYNYLWRYREGVFDVPFMRALPQTFHEELLFDICQEMFDKSQLFYNLDPALLRTVSKAVTIALYNPNMLLCRQGDYANKMYYILQGECQAMSKLNPANPSAIIRAGSIVGEANLFFSFPYTTVVETRTCCQFIILQKKDLLLILDKYPVELEILRSRTLTKIKEVYETHQAFGIDPVCWVKAKTKMENPSYPNAEKLRRNMRWGTGINKEVLEDVVDDAEESVIFDTPCSDPSVTKNHLAPYISCVVPEIMTTDARWIIVWNVFIMILALFYAFAGTYCLVFGDSSEFEYYVCQVQKYLSGFISVAFVADVFVEILGACPVAGLYYKFWDGLSVVRHQPTFALDILAALPLDVLSHENQNFAHVLGVFFKVLKLWQVLRYLHYLDNVHPLKLFWFRLVQTLIVLLYGIHFIACISYFVACPYDNDKKAISCKEISWWSSYEIDFRLEHDVHAAIPNNIKANTLAYGHPYLYSFYYSAAILSSAGFGDFNPQSRTEMMWAIAFQLIGFYLIGYYTSILTSALSCVVRPKLALQQQLVSLYQFMNHHNLCERLQNRIVEYFTLQHQMRGGVELGSSSVHFMYDAPPYLRDDVLYLEVFELLDGVPVLSKVDADVIIFLSSHMKRFIIPPNTTFVRIGEVRRILYVIRSGSMGVYENGCDEPVSVLEASCHFGVRDLLFGEPSHYVIRSLSHVYMYAITWSLFEEALQENEDDFWNIVNEEKSRVRDAIHQMTLIYSKLQIKGVDADKATRIPSWNVIPTRIKPPAKKRLSKEESRKIAHVNRLNDEYEELFKLYKRSSFLKLFLLRKTIHPVGYFSKLWNCLMSLVCSMTLVTLMLETFCYIRTPWFRAFQVILDWINYVDIYLKLHWSYYNPHNGMLVTHPMKTAINYIKHGSLIFDIAICAPLELSVWMLGLTNLLGYGKAASWYSRFRWIRFLQFKRIPIVFQIVHKIFKHRGIILLTLYVTATLVMCTIISTVAQYIACPWQSSYWEEGDQERIPLCLKTGWVANKYADVDTNPHVISDIWRRWILGLYYVSQVVLVIGFGDLIQLHEADIILLVFMCVFGFIFMRCVIADMTAAEVDSDEARTKFVERMMVLDLVMRREKVPKRISEAVMSHLRYTWKKSRGLQTSELFGDLHPVLESELYKSLVGDRLQKVPIFHSFTPAILRSMCSYINKYYILRGDRIMRYGNLEYEMCIIIIGKVYITDQYLNYICSLGPGESFGESSLIYGTARRHNAIAACNTEIYVLTSSRFNKFSERYPNFKREMKKKLASNQRDYFEKIIDKKMKKSQQLSPEQKSRMLETFEYRSTIVKDLVAQKEDFQQAGLDTIDVELKKKNFLFGYGKSDDNLPLIYFAIPSTRLCRCPVIHPNCPLMRYFFILIKWLCFITPAIAVYEISFLTQFLQAEDSDGMKLESFAVSKVLYDISEVVEAVFVVHIILQFFTAYEVQPRVYNKSHYCIVLRYATSPDGLFLDVIASIPFLLEQTGVDRLFSGPNKKFWQYVYILRVIRLYHYFKYQTSRKDDLDISVFRYKITLSVTSFCLMAHMLACIFYFISPCKRPDLTNKTEKFTNLCPPPLGEEEEDLEHTGWTTDYVTRKGIQMKKEALVAWRWWFRSMYWVVTCISTTGFGDIVPVTINEMAVGIFCIFCGAFILSIILSQFTSGMASLTRTNREYMYHVLLLVKHLANIGLSENRQTQVMMYFLTMWSRCRGVAYHKTWHTLPVSMRIEVANALFGNTLNNVPFFQDTKEKIFIRQLSRRVTHSLYIPGNYIYKDGDQGSKLFVVYKGLVSRTQMTMSGVPELISIYNPGDAFGRFAAFFHDGTYKKSYRAETMVEVLEVKQKDILHLAEKFPRFKRIITRYIKSRYSSQGSNLNIFSPKRRKAKLFGMADDLMFTSLVKKATEVVLKPEDNNRRHRKLKDTKKWDKLAEVQRLAEPKLEMHQHELDQKAEFTQTKRYSHKKSKDLPETKKPLVSKSTKEEGSAKSGSTKRYSKQKSPHKKRRSSDKSGNSVNSRGKYSADSGNKRKSSMDEERKPRKSKDDSVSSSKKKKRRSSDGSNKSNKSKRNSKGSSGKSKRRSSGKKQARRTSTTYQGPIDVKPKRYSGYDNDSFSD